MEEEEKRRYDEAQSVWDNLETIEPTWSTEKEPRSESSSCYSTPLVTLEDFIQYLKNSQHVQSQNIEVHEVHNRQPTHLSDKITHFFKCCLKKNEKLANHELEEQKSLIFKVSRASLLDNEERMYFNVLLTLYRQFTGNRFDVPRYGEHWEDIGFQGNDPATDLRGVGLLGLVQPLFLVSSPELKNLALDFYRLSVSETQNFPFLVLSLNATRMALTALRDELLNGLCNQKRDVWTAVNLFYASIVFRIYHIWKTQKLTIKDSGYVLKEVEEYSRKCVDPLVTGLEEHLMSSN